MLPSTAAIFPATAPTLDYRFHVSTGNPATLHVRLLPPHPLVSGQVLRPAVSITATISEWDRLSPCILQFQQAFHAIHHRFMVITH